MSNVIEDVLHVVLDVLSGKKASLPQVEADELHEQVTPGHTAVPLTAEQQAQLDALSKQQADAARKAAEAEAEAARRAAAGPDEEPAGNEEADADA